MTIRRAASPALICALLPLLLAVAACDTWRDSFRPKNADSQKLPVARAPLPESAFRVRWGSHTVPREMASHSEADVRISFTNLGDAVWPDRLSADPEKRDGSYAVRLTYEWVAASTGPSRTGRRVELPHPVHPGETMTLLVHVQAPDRPGDYRLTFGLVQELVTWFDAKGAAMLVVPVTVQ